MIIAAHWRLLPPQVAALSQEELDFLEYSYLLYERRQGEYYTDAVGALLGAQWSVDAILAGNLPPKIDSEKDFTWSLRPPRERIATPISMIMTKGKLMEQLKPTALSIKMKDRNDAAVINRPAASWTGTKTEIVELGLLPKNEFLAMARSLGGGKAGR